LTAACLTPPTKVCWHGLIQVDGVVDGLYTSPFNVLRFGALAKICANISPDMLLLRKFNSLKSENISIAASDAVHSATDKNWGDILIAYCIYSTISLPAKKNAISRSAAATLSEP